MIKSEVSQYPFESISAHNGGQKRETRIPVVQLVTGPEKSVV